MLMCASVEYTQDLKSIRDLSFIEELLKTKAILKLMSDKLKSSEADVDLIEYSMATKVLENKLQILESLNVTVEGDSEKQLTLNIQGSEKAIQLDLEKLKDCITVEELPIPKKEVKPLTESVLKNIDSELKEDEFLEETIKAIGEIKKTPKKLLEKETFVRVFKYVGDFAKYRSKSQKQIAQDKRMEHFEVDGKKYLEQLQKTIQEEEEFYEQSSNIIFERLCISPECFQRTQKDLMNDQDVSMQLFELGITMEKPSGNIKEELSKEKTIELVLESNNFAFDYFEKNYLEQLQKDPMMMPVLISAIAHDWVKKNHGHNEDDFKTALFGHKIYEEPKVSAHMQQKQMQLMTKTPGFN